MDVMQELAARAEITDVVVRLGRWLDGHDEDPTTIYAEDIVAHSPRGSFHGLDEVLALVARGQAAGEGTQHFHTDIAVTVDGDTALAEANQLVQFFELGQAPHRTSGLTVSYGMARRAGGWRIVTSDIRLRWIIGELPT